MTVERMARAHWWTRVKHRYDNGNPPPLNRLTNPEVEEAWQEVKALEIQAMQTALGTVTLKHIIE